MPLFVVKFAPGYIHDIAKRMQRRTQRQSPTGNRDLFLRLSVLNAGKTDDLGMIDIPLPNGEVSLAELTVTSGY